MLRPGPPTGAVITRAICSAMGPQSTRNLLQKWAMNHKESGGLRGVITSNLLSNSPTNHEQSAQKSHTNSCGGLRLVTRNC